MTLSSNTVTSLTALPLASSCVHSPDGGAAEGEAEGREELGCGVGWLLGAAVGWLEGRLEGELEGC
jgi:hypothetical protein